jgi:hypothetical protein
VKQISARASRATAEALDELDAAILQSPLRDTDEEISIEIESIERVRLDMPGSAPPSPPQGNAAYGQLPWERRTPPMPNGGAGSARPQQESPPAGPRRSLDEDLKFDPLFDEDE